MMINFGDSKMASLLMASATVLCAMIWWTFTHLPNDELH